MQIPTFNTTQDLEKYLLKYPAINRSQWTKTLDSLFEELREGECYLAEEKGKLYRKVDVVCVKCFYTKEGGEKLRLFEEKQVFKREDRQDERVRKNFHFVAEKMKPDETPKQAAIRILAEALNISGPHVRVGAVFKDAKTQTRDSPFYCGIENVYRTYVFTHTISSQDYRERYKEKQGDKRTYFSWMKIARD